MKKNQVAKAKSSNIKKADKPEVYEGMKFLNGDGDIYTITKVFKNGKIEAQEEGSDYPTRFESTDELFNKYTLLDKPIEEYKAELIRELSTDFSSFDMKEATSTDMVLSSGKEKALEAKRSLEAINKKMDILTSIMNKHRNHLSTIQDKYQKQLKEINKVIGIIELYLGVHEDITQIQEGEPATAEDPICFRQLVLHMDEEVGTADDGGIDIYKVEEFDKWLKKNTDRVLPEKKGVVVIRPRRNEKDYRVDDPFYQAEMDDLNRMTFILIRNGENLYRIWSGNIHIYPHLFPNEKEMNELMSEEHGFNSKYWNQEKKDDIILGYKRNALFLQSLIDRTNIFKPHAPEVHIFKPETHEGNLRFIYDADGITDGRISYQEWRQNLNDKLQRGDRLYFTGFNYHDFGDSERDRKAEEERRFPIPGWTYRPAAGVYNIDRIEKYTGYYDNEKDALICLFKPREEVFDKGTWEHKERKMSQPFRLFRADEHIINYELIKIEDIDYYMNDRINRRSYLEMMPVLKGIKKRLIQEQKMEVDFIKMVQGQLLKEKKVKFSEEEVREVIAWWKTRVIEKRPLSKDDAKAARMIVDELKRRLKK
jgi:hypothetical protein